VIKPAILTVFISGLLVICKLARIRVFFVTVDSDAGKGL